jgi:lipopolysaccharide/colanic/teichoic acid biosynthesis glycosyltransferase
MYHACKRAFDIVVAIAVGLVVAPVAAVVALMLWIAQGQVLFRQLRPGLHGRPFVLYKFCSMNNSRDEHGVLLPDEQRLTRIGNLVRGLSLDELPQLWNVLKGDMSLVGPRPLLMQYLDRYTPEQARRHEARPGITGWAQVNGRNALEWKDKFALDVWYVDHQSMRLDFTILAMTAWRVLARKGISSRHHATMPEFTGQEERVEHSNDKNMAGGHSPVNAHQAVVPHGRASE